MNTPPSLLAKTHTVYTYAMDNDLVHIFYVFSIFIRLLAIPRGLVAFSFVVVAIPRVFVAFSFVVVAIPRVFVAFSFVVVAIPRVFVAFSFVVVAVRNDLVAIVQALYK